MSACSVVIYRAAEQGRRKRRETRRRSYPPPTSRPRLPATLVQLWTPGRLLTRLGYPSQTVLAIPPRRWWILQPIRWGSVCPSSTHLTHFSLAMYRTRTKAWRRVSILMGHTQLSPAMTLHSHLAAPGVQARKATHTRTTTPCVRMAALAKRKFNSRCTINIRTPNNPALTLPMVGPRFLL